MKKKVLSLLVTFAMLFSMLPATALAAGETVAKIGETTYETFSEAMTAANAMTGAVIVEVYGEVEFTNGMELKNGSYPSITFVGKSETAKITINQSAGGDYLEAHGKTVAFEDLILAKANPAWAGNSGHMGNYFSIQGGTVTYDSCTFPNGACTSGGTATYNDCTFQNTSEYGLWVYDDAFVTVEGGTIESKKGIKVYSEDEASITSTLTVKNATFTENVTAKPAVAIGYAESITLIGNTYNNSTGVLELDSGSDADCEGVTFVAEDAEGNDIASTLTAVDRSNSNAACGVLVDGKIYTTITEAAEDIESGDTVTLLYSTEETVELPEGVELTLADGVTAENVTVAGPVLGVLDIGVVTDDANVENDSYVYFDLSSLNAANSIEIKLYSGDTLLSTTVLVNEEYVTHTTLSAKVEITDNSSSWDTTWAVEPISNLIPDKAELYVDGTLADTVNQINMYNTDYPEKAREWKDIEGVATAPAGTITPAYTRTDGFWGEGKSNAAESYVVELYEGETKIASASLNDVGNIIDGTEKNVTWSIPFAGSTDEYWTVEWTEGYPKYDMSPDTVKLVVDDTLVATNNVQFNAPDNLNKIVASTADPSGTLTGYYTTLADALSAAANGGTVQLLSGSTAISAAGAVYGKTVTITGEAVFDWSKGNLFVGRGGEGDGKLIFKNAVITSSSNNSSTGIHVSGREKETDNKYDGTLVIDNSTIELDYLINRGTIEVIGDGTVGETPNLEVKNGFGIAGRPASETESGEAATATITIKNGAYVKVLNHNGMGVGTASATPEGYGVLNLEDSKFECASFNVTKDLGTFNVSGESVVAINALSGGGVMYLNGVELDENTAITGTETGVIKVASGTNNISGSTIKVKTFQVGTGNEGSNVAPTENVVVNLMDGAVLSTKGSAYDGWVGSKYRNTISDVRYILNIDESVATFGYLHVSKDGVLNVTGDVAEESKAYIASGYYTFYVGDFIVNGVATLDDVDTRVQYGKVSVDNADAGESAGTLNIKNCDEIVFAAEGNDNSALKWWNSGIVNIENSTVSARTPNITATGALNLVGSEFSASNTAITNAGTITMDATSKITATDVAGDGDVAIDATGFTGTKTVIDVDSTTTLTNNKLTVTGSDYKRSSGDVILVNVGDVESGTLYVNTDWTSQDAIDAVMGELSGYEYNTNVFDTLSAAFSAAGNGNTVEIMSAGTYELSTSGKDITITGSVDGVVFDNIGAKNMGGANVTFNNVTFDYYPNTTYTGLQHSGNLTYNNCIINGQVFLYGASETFNNCTFNQNSADAYNVWTYGAKDVAFNECTFNSVGKSVLVYNEGAGATDLTVTDTEFIASASADGKAAIEIDTSLMPEGTDIVIDDKTTATGFDAGSVSGNSLWNDKKDQTDLTVTVGEEQVWPIAVAQIGDQKFYSLQDAVNAAVENETVTITLLTDTSEAARIDIGSKKDITIVGQVNGEGEYPAFTGWFKVTGKLTLKDVTLVAPSTAVPGETTSQYTKTVIGLMNTGDVVCENVTFDMSNAVADSTAITAWWSTGDGANITVTGCTFDCAGQRPIRSDACVTVEGCTFNDPYRYAVQMTSKSSTMAADAEAYVVFNNNTIVDGENGKEYVYGVQLEGGYGCSDLTITGTGNTITADENDGSTLYFVENTDNMGFETIQWKTETAPVLDQSTFAAKIAGTDGDIYLPTLAEAIGIVAADGTVTLVANSTEEIAINKALTIELNGFTAEKVTPADGYAVVKYETKWVFGAADSVVPVTGVTLSGATSVNVGNTITLTATVAPDNATDKTVTWTSSNESVATVADGVVTGVAAGTATITVTTADGGFTADCTVTVSRASSGGGGGGSYNPSYTITAEDTENGSITVSPSRASSGSTVTITVDPDSGYELDELTVLDKNGKEVKLTKKSDSKYTFKMPSGKVTVEATFAEIEAFENPFTDVAEGAYYYDAVLWAAENGITGGTSATTFSPTVTCTRAQTVTFLWRAAGSPDPEGTNMPFTDVASDAYYYDAVLWAVENGITSGTSATTFSPNATVTRAQNVTFLWRWAESSAVEAVNPFTDVAADMYYHDAVLWAADEGITAGTSATTFSPDDPCLRSQIVTFLYRYLVK